MQNTLNFLSRSLLNRRMKSGFKRSLTPRGENSKREFNSCRTSMTPRVGIHPRVTRPARMQMLVPSSSRLHSFSFPFVPAEKVFSASIHLLRR